MSNVQLMQGNCLDLMKKLADQSVDMILCDLPYGVTEATWDNVLELDLLWEQYERLITDNGAIVLFGSEPFSSKVRMSNLKMYRYDWIWKKNKGTLFQQAHKMPLKDFENIMVFYKHLPTYNPQMRIGKVHNTSHGPKNKSNARRGSGIFATKPIKYIEGRTTNEYYPVRVIEFNNVNQRGQYHPTQKPVDLLEYLIKTYTNKGDKVLDNTMGSGSTGVACVHTQRDFIGMELNEKYFEIAKTRIEEAKKEELQNETSLDV